MYYQSPIPPTGFSDSSPTYSLRNNGVEVTLNSINLDKRIKWNTSVNFTLLKIRLLIWIKAIFPEIIYSRRVIIRAYNLVINAGVDPAIGKALYYTDKNRDVITANPLLAIPQITKLKSKFYGGITNSFSYNGFDISFFWQFVYGNDIFGREIIDLASNSNNPYNKTVDYFNNYWRNPGDLVIYPKPILSTVSENTNSTLYLFDGSYLRLNDLTIWYTLPSSFSSKYKLASARFFARGTNLLTITKYPGWTPDIYDTESLNVPQSQVISFGLQLGFL